MTEQHLTHLYCLMQNRLGALDRVLNALTHRGILPQRMTSTLLSERPVTEGNEDGQARPALELVVSFHADDEKIVDKLVKFLQKQVYTLEVHYTTLNDPELDPTDVHPALLEAQAATR